MGAGGAEEVYREDRGLKGSSESEESLYTPFDHEDQIYHECNGVKELPEPSSNGNASKFECQRSKGKKVLGVEFAPVKIPLERRLQTFAVLQWLLTFFLMGPSFLLLFIYIVVATPLWPIPLLYVLWYFWDKDSPSRGGNSSTWVRNWALWRHYVNYFPIKLVKTIDLDPSKNYLFCSHPHGVLCSGAFGNFATEGTQVSKVFPGLTTHLMTFDLQFSPFVPLYRDYIQRSGTVSASKESLNHLLGFPGGGKAPVLVVGGAPESLDTHPGTYKLHLKDRKGFIKVALRHGAPLVPVFSFGETSIYDQVSNPEGSLIRRVQNWIQRRINLAPVIMLGRGVFQYSFGILPHRKPITTVVGAPLELPKITNPTQEEVNHWHGQYVRALEDLFLKHRDKYESPNVHLTII